MRNQAVLDDQYDRGFLDGLSGIYKPGMIFGESRKAYRQGYNQGIKLRKSTTWLKSKMA